MCTCGNCAAHYRDVAAYDVYFLDAVTRGQEPLGFAMWAARRADA